MIRDFVTILYGEEIVIVLVTASFFLGLSVGCLLALRLSLRIFQYVFAGSVFLHLTLSSGLSEKRLFQGRLFMIDTEKGDTHVEKGNQPH